MSKTIIPANYTPALNLYDTQRAIGTVKRLFADTLCATLNLYRVSAPLFLEASTGLNDDLNGVERKVTASEKLRAKLSNAYYGEDNQIPKPTSEEYKEITSGHGHH